MKYPDQEHPGTIDWQFSRDVSAWRCLVRLLYPEKFKQIDEGMRVSWDTGDPGTVTSVVYFPKGDSYLITVLRSNRQYYFVSPNDLEVVK